MAGRTGNSGTNTKTNKKRCVNCGLDKPITQFISGMDTDGRDTCCTPCRQKKFGKSLEGLQRYTELSKRGFSSNLWNMCMEIAESSDKNKELMKDMTDKEKSKFLEQKSINLYFSKMNLPGVGDITDSQSNLSQDTNQEIDEDLVKFWGRFSNYTREDYEVLQDNYDSWITECKSDTLAEKKLYKQICLQEIEIQKLREQGKSVVKETESLQKLMDSANVKPKDINAANDPSNASVLGMIIKDIEKYRPAEYFEDKKLYTDFDGLKEYFTRFVTRPLKNLLTGSRDFDKEFNLDKDSDDNDE